jgi:1,4-alpha-glucan branching enzyme
MDNNKATGIQRVRSVLIEARIERAHNVRVTGEFNDWELEGILLDHNGSGLWQTTIALVPGEYQYRLLVDGEWRDHAEAEKRVPNPFGSENCVLVVD